MRFLVIVNQKYIVAVDAETNGGAEHRVLDQVKGVGSALAFDPVKESGLDCYKQYIETCEFMSFGELCNRSNRNEAAKLRELNLFLEREYELATEIQKLNTELGVKEELLSEVRRERNSMMEEWGMTEASIVPEETLQKMESSYEPNRK